jgi:hypothetical protein
MQLDARFADLNAGEGDGFLGAIKSTARLPSEVSNVVGPLS